MFLFPYAEWMNLIITIALGIFIGFVLPPLSAHTASMHMGYNLLNVGFSGGVLAFVIVCILRSLGMECDSVLIWSEGRDKFITIGLFGYFILTAVFGFWINGGTVRGLRRLFQHPGRAVTDFVLMDGAGVTLMNMGIVGIISTAYNYFYKRRFFRSGSGSNSDGIWLCGIWSSLPRIICRFCLEYF